MTETSNHKQTSESPQAGFLAKHGALLLAAWQQVVRSPVRGGTLILCVAALICPLVTGIAVCEGIKSEYAAVLKQGGDVYVTGDNYGSNAPVDLSVGDEIALLDGVTKVVPRIVARTHGQGKFMAVLGIDHGFIPAAVRLVEGRPPLGTGEVIMGSGLAKHLGLSVDSRFSIDRSPRQAFQVVGLFEAPFTIWEADLVVMGFEDASRLFGVQGKATDIVVHTRPGYEQIVDLIVRMSLSAEHRDRPPLRVQTRDLIERYIQRGFNIKAGVFAWFYCVVFVLGIASVGVISGFGVSDRGREIGVMKALGWQTQDVLELVALENLILASIAAGVTIFAATLWAHFFNGKGPAGFFIAGLNILAPFPVPWKIFPVPFTLGCTSVLILTMVGSMYSTWKTAVVPPSDALKS